MATKDQESLWSSVLAELKLSLSKTIFTTLFADTSLKNYTDGQVTINCPNSYLADLIRKRYSSLIKSAIESQTQQPVELNFEIKAEPSKTKKDSGPLFDKKEKQKSQKEPKKQNKQVFHKQFSAPHTKKANLHPNFNFNTFVVGDTNHFAFAASQGIIKNPGEAYNPLFMWGGVGVGKTHLMQAIGNKLMEAYPNWKILYVSAETFSSELVAALKENTMNKFKHKYRNVDAFLVDDVQFIAGKEYTQDEFFHTFNALYMANKQVILTSDRKPEEIQPLKDRLTSRFMGGLTVDIQPPDFEMRVAILKQKAEQRNIPISEDAITFIAETIKSNARELEGNLTQIAAQAQAKNTQPDLKFVKNFFGFKQNNHHQKKSVSHRTILSKVAKHFDVKTSEIKGRSRKKNIATARHISAYLLRKELQFPLKRIGELLGGRDHTTIMHSEEKVDRLFSTNQQIRHDILQIRKAIYE
jgi:chromosomal replication initiator protein